MYRDNDSREYGGGTSKPEYVNKCKDAIAQRQTIKTLERETSKVCDLLHESVGIVGQYREKFDKETEIFHDRKCLFARTEGNYQRYRNIDIFISTDLTQFSESVKTNVAVYSKGYKELNETLKNVAKGIKDLKTKVGALKDASCHLHDQYDDDCNKTQRRAITGKADGCPPANGNVCDYSGNTLSALIYIPIGLKADADILFKSSYDVVGIQTFSNVESFEGLQKKLDEQSKKFTKHLNETAKTREGDLKKLQEDLVKSTQEVEKSYLDLNHNRTNYEGYYDAAKFLCEPGCGCGKTEPEKSEYQNKREPKDKEDVEKVYSRSILETCHKEICEICKVVDNTLCCEPEKPPVPTIPPPPNPPSTEC